MIRPPLMLFAAALAVLLGMAGLVRGSIPQSGASGSTNVAQGIVVGGAYVRESANGVNVAAYFTVYNLGSTPDVLTSVSSGAGAESSLHSDTPDGRMVALVTGLQIPARGTVALVPGKYHLMIEKLYGPLKVGQTVNLQLTFAQAGDVLVTAPVIAISVPAPTAAAPK